MKCDTRSWPRSKTISSGSLWDGNWTNDKVEFCIGNVDFEGALWGRAWGNRVVWTPLEGPLSLILNHIGFHPFTYVKSFTLLHDFLQAKLVSSFSIVCIYENWYYSLHKQNCHFGKECLISILFCYCVDFYKKEIRVSTRWQAFMIMLKDLYGRLRLPFVWSDRYQRKVVKFSSLTQNNM